MFDKIGFNEVLKTPSNKKSSVSLLKNVVVRPIAKQASKRSTARLLSEEYGINTHLTSIDRMMDFIIVLSQENDNLNKIIVLYVIYALLIIVCFYYRLL